MHGAAARGHLQARGPVKPRTTQPAAASAVSAAAGSKQTYADVRLGAGGERE